MSAADIIDARAYDGSPARVAGGIGGGSPENSGGIGGGSQGE
jgi:hypothetical protein